MAKMRGVTTMIKAKPNARGKTSHLPLACRVKGCDEEAFLMNKSGKLDRVCTNHWLNPPLTRKASAEIVLRSLGLIP